MLCVVLNVIEFEMDVEQAVAAPRLHHQWLPDQIRVEPSLVKDHPQAIDELRALGHKFADKPQVQGDAHTLWIDPRTGEITAAPDTRISGAAAGH